jgi:hypothetical protein
MAKHRRLGIVLIVLGVVGVVTGVIPLAASGLRIVLTEDPWNFADLFAHGMEAMGLSPEWAMLSSAMGAFLGVLRRP